MFINIYYFVELHQGTYHISCLEIEELECSATAASSSHSINRKIMPLFPIIFAQLVAETCWNINIEYRGQTEQRSVETVASVDIVMIAPHQVTIMS